VSEDVFLNALNDKIKHYEAKHNSGVDVFKTLHGLKIAKELYLNKIIKVMK